MAAKSREFDIIIAGGGIAGLALAAILARAGLRAALIEPHPPAPLKDTEPSGRTVALMDSSLNIIRATGMWDQIAARSCALKVMRIIDDSRAGEEPLEIEFPASDIGLEQFGFNIPNAVLRAALHEHAARDKNITLYAPAALASYTADNAGVTATLESGETLSAPLIVGADGRASRVRELAGISVREHDYNQKAITCLINHSRTHENISSEFHRSAGPFALVPLPGNQSAVVWVESSDRADELMKLKKDDFTQALAAQTRDLLGGITLETGPECWPLKAIRAARLTAPRAVLIAEAAHVMSPITAQGLNLSLRDVAALAETVLDAMRAGLDLGSAVILDKYARRRRIDMTTRVLGVDAMNRIVSTDAQVLKSLRRAGLKSLDAIPHFKKIAMKAGLAPEFDLGRLAKGHAL